MKSLLPQLQLSTQLQNFMKSFIGVRLCIFHSQNKQKKKWATLCPNTDIDNNHWKIQETKALPFLHRAGLSPCIPPGQRTDSTPSCAWYGTSQIGNRALIRTLRVLLDSFQKNTGKVLLTAENGRTPLCPTSSFFFFSSFSCVRRKPWQEKRHSSSWLSSSCLRQGVSWKSRDNNL